MAAERIGDKAVAVIVAKNEGATIAKVIAEAKAQVREVVVVCDCESDTTVEAVRKAGAKVLINSLGPGKGKAIRFAIEHCQADILVFMDADGSHHARDIIRLIEPIRQGNADMVVGSRILGGSDELSNGLAEKTRYWANRAGSGLTNWMLGSRLSDVFSGFRAVTGKMARGFDLKEPRFAVELEMVMKCLKANGRIVEIAVHESKRQQGTSRLNSFVQCFDCIRCGIAQQ